MSPRCSPKDPQLNLVQLGIFSFGAPSVHRPIHRAPRGRGEGLLLASLPDRSLLTVGASKDIAALRRLPVRVTKREQYETLLFSYKQKNGTTNELYS